MREPPKSLPPSTVKVIDSVKAQKALECVKAISKVVARYHDPADMGPEDCDDIGLILKKYGF